MRGNQSETPADIWLRLRRFMAIPISFEGLFVLFLFARIYKSDPRFDWLPVDITALLFGLSILSGGSK